VSLAEVLNNVLGEPDVSGAPTAASDHRLCAAPMKGCSAFSSVALVPLAEVDLVVAIRVGEVTASAAFATVDLVDDGYNLPGGRPRDPHHCPSPEHPTSPVR
jgi:hypothetical protein